MVRYRLKVGFLLYGAALTAGAAVVSFCVATHGWGAGAGVGAFVLGVSGLAVIIGSLAQAGVAACPSCGRDIDRLFPRKNKVALCDGCGAYAEGEGGRLWRVAEDKVAERPLYGALLPGSYQWPASCAVCTEAPTRTVPVTLSVPNVRRTVITGALTAGAVHLASVTRYTLQVPHCARHADGAKLRLVVTPLLATPVIVEFRSRAFHRAFCLINNVRPVDWKRAARRFKTPGR